MKVAAIAGMVLLMAMADESFAKLDYDPCYGDTFQSQCACKSDDDCGPFQTCSTGPGSLFSTSCFNQTTGAVTCASRPGLEFTCDDNQFCGWGCWPPEQGYSGCPDEHDPATGYYSLCVSAIGPGGKFCQTNDECDTGFCCVSTGACLSPGSKCGPVCSSNIDCISAGANYVCVDGQCVPPPNPPSSRIAQLFSDSVCRRRGRDDLATAAKSCITGARHQILA